MTSSPPQPRPGVSVLINQTEINGFLSTQNIENYLGIKYARIPSRFRPAVLISPHISTSPSKVSAVNFGPRCPQPRNFGREKRHHLYEGVTPMTETKVDEMECLCLNVFAPHRDETAKGRLPVVAWIHGGGFVYGDGGSEYGSCDRSMESGG